MSKTDRILEEIRERGLVSPFWTSLSRVPYVLETYWQSFNNLLSSGTISKEAKMMISYECALADGCPTCTAVNKQMLVGVGISKEMIEKLEKDIKGSSLDEQTKNMLIYSYHVAKNPHSADENFHSAFKTLLGEERLVEIAAWVNNCSAILNITHSLQLHK